MLAAAALQNLENMIWLLENGADPNLLLPHSSNLKEAIRGLHSDAVAVLIEAGSEVDARIGSSKTTALQETIYVYAGSKYDQQIQIIEMLLKSGANPNYRPDGISQTLIEQIKHRIQTDVEGSRDLEHSSNTRERFRRSLVANRTILGLLESYQN